MSALFDFQAFLTVLLLCVCTATYVKLKTPALLDSRHGFRGLFWKFARVGERLSPWVGLGCFLIALANLFRG
jgi:hypothetical protein